MVCKLESPIISFAFLFSFTTCFLCSLLKYPAYTLVSIASYFGVYYPMDGPSFNFLSILSSLNLLIPSNTTSLSSKILKTLSRFLFIIYLACYCFFYVDLLSCYLFLRIELFLFSF